MDDEDRLRQTLRSARILLFIQGVVATANCVVLVLDAVGQARDGVGETPVSGFSLSGSAVVAVGLFVSAVLPLRHGWARVLALAIEVVAVVLAVVTLVGGDVWPGLSRLGLAAVVLLVVVQYELECRRTTAAPPEERV